MQSFQSLQSTMIPSLDGVDLAGRLLEWHMKNDNQFPQVSDQLRVGQEGRQIHFGNHFFWYTIQVLSIAAYGVSGLSDADYPSLGTDPSGLPLLRQMGIVNRVPLPPELVEHFGRKTKHKFSSLKFLYYIESLNRYAKLLYDGTLSNHPKGLAKH